MLMRIFCSGVLAWSVALAAPAFGNLLDKNRYAITDFTYARTFAGGSSTDHLLIETPLRAGSQLSLSVWLNATSLDATPRAIVFWDKTDDTVSNVLVFSTSTALTMHACGGFSPCGNWTVTPPSTGTWHHLAITYDPSSTANNPVVYLDGTSVPVTTTASPVGTWNPWQFIPVMIGNGFNSVLWDMPWHGSIAGVALWDVILSSADLAALADHGDPCGLSVSRFAPEDPTWNQSGLVPHLQAFVPMGYGDNLAAQPFEEAFSFSGWSATVTGATLTTWTGLPMTRYWGCMDVH